MPAARAPGAARTVGRRTLCRALGPVLATVAVAFPLAASPVAGAAAPPVDWALHGFPDVVAAARIQPGQAATVQYGGISVAVPGNAFSSPVWLEILEGPLSAFAAQAPAGTVPVADFAFRVMDAQTGAYAQQFGAPVHVTVTGPGVGEGSAYYNIAADGSYHPNPVAPVIQGQTLSHPVTGDPVGWVVTGPAGAVPPTPVSALPAGAPAWLASRFPDVVARAAVGPGQGATLSGGGLQAVVPANAFSAPAEFYLLQGPVPALQPAAPAGQTVVADFAFLAVDAQSGQPVMKFAQPVAVTVHDARITASARYWNVLPTGAFATNPVAPQISAGALTHGNIAAAVGWAVTVPAAGSTYTVVAGDTLWAIAQRSGTTVAALQQANAGRYPGLTSNPNLILPGWTLQV